MRRKREKVEETQPVVRDEQGVDGWVRRSMTGVLREEIRMCVCARVCVCVVVVDK